jgi:hypothetical protein
LSLRTCGPGRTRTRANAKRSASATKPPDRSHGRVAGVFRSGLRHTLTRGDVTSLLFMSARLSSDTSRTFTASLSFARERSSRARSARGPRADRAYLEGAPRSSRHRSACSSRNGCGNCGPGWPSGLVAQEQSGFGGSSTWTTQPGRSRSSRRWLQSWWLLLLGPQRSPRAPLQLGPPRRKRKTTPRSNLPRSLRELPAMLWARV